jgi:hypothetical protein
MAEPLVPDSGTAEERGWIGGRLLRARAAGRQGVQLDSHERRRRVRGVFRFYGPEKPLFEKTWRLPDIEKI